MHVGVHVLGSASLRRTDTQELGLVGCFSQTDPHPLWTNYNRRFFNLIFFLFLSPSNMTKEFVFSPCDWRVALVTGHDLKFGWVTTPTK